MLVDRPYVSADFKPHGSVGQTVTKSDRSFACLGVMLVELAFGTSLDDHELWSSFGDKKSNRLFRQMVARQWADSVEGEAGPDYSGAVMWCLNESPTTLEGEQWREDLANKVVLPLQNCCDWMQRKTAVAAT